MKKILISIFVFVLVLCIGLPVNAVSALDSIETQAKDKIVYETSHGVVASSTILSKEKSALESDSGFYIKICFDYSYPEENVPLLRKDATAEEADAALVRHRENVRKFYAEKNNELIKNYNLSGDIFISQYTSFVIIHEESYESNLNLLNQMTKDKNIQRIYITEDDIYENQIAESTEVPAWVYAPPISLADAYKTFCFSDSLFSTNGTGVKVGVVEAAGLVNPNDPTFLPNSVIIHNKSGAVYNELHSTLVAAVISGTQGIARGSTIYSTYCGYGLLTNLEWLVNNGINVINNSWFSIFSGVMGYNSDSSYLDQFVRSSKVSIVASSGNQDDNNPNSLISGPGAARNVITVGSIDSKLQLSLSSSYMTTFAISKPEIVSIGENLMIPGFVHPVTHLPYFSGTSFSTPMVTAAIACLMQKFPTLKYYPEMVKSLIVGAASEIIWENTEEEYFNNLDASGLHPKQGSGLLNIASAIDNYWFTFYNEVSSANSNSVVCSQSIYLSGFNYLKACVTWTSNDAQNFSDYNIRVLDPNGNVVSIAGYTYFRSVSASTFNTTEMIQTYLIGTGQFKVEVYLRGAKKSGTDRIGLTLNF